MRLYHGGFRGLTVGDLVVPSAPHVEDGCPICTARSAGRVFTAREARAWALTMGERGRPMLDALRDAPDDQAIDPPTAKRAVYLTTSIEYATWYAARSRGDLYRVEPVGPIVRSEEDSLPTWTAETARVVEVIRRRVALDRRERRALDRLWRKADRRREARTA